MGATLAWATDTLSSAALLPSAGLSYAYILYAAATPKGEAVLERRIAKYKAMLP